MDNYYASITLFEEFKESKMLAYGTVRSYRVNLPREICGLNENAVKNLIRGECTGKREI